VRQLEEKKGEVVMNVANIALVVAEGFVVIATGSVWSRAVMLAS
jgi:hypothetical protein